jgi:hypothetical protein
LTEVEVPVRRFGVLSILCFVLGCGPATAKEPPLKVLFVGNSYTSVNDLPGMLSEFSRSRPGQRIETDQETPGGCTLLKHAQDGKAADKIRSREWDFVVLQEQSQVPFMAPPMMENGAKKLHDLVQEKGARTMFYLTWAREIQPENQAAINHSYFHCAEKLHADVAPVGIAWQRVQKSSPEIKLYADDGSHPSPSGTYLAACVFYAKLFGKSPEGLPPKVTHNGHVLADIDPATAQLLQAVAWRTVQEVKDEKSSR